MWYWSDGSSWPGFALMAVAMVICLVMMFRMTGGGWICGFGRRLESPDAEDAGEGTPRTPGRTDNGGPEEGR